MRRALIFAHFDPQGIVDPHVMYALTCYRQYFGLIYFVSTANLDTEACKRVSAVVDRVILRRNIGYDFMSWKVGYFALPDPRAFDEVIFANDSCYGPCSDLDGFFLKASNLIGDLWGATMNRQIRPHVQSFFMAFRQSLLCNGFADRFWSSVKEIQNKGDLIMKYEVGLSRRVEEEGMRVAAVVDFPKIDIAMRERAIDDNYSLYDSNRSEIALAEIMRSQTPNPMQLYWAECLRLGVPHLKVELVRDNPLHANLANVYRTLRSAKWFDPHLISSHMGRLGSLALFPPTDDLSNTGMLG